MIYTFDSGVETKVSVPLFSKKIYDNILDGFIKSEAKLLHLAKQMTKGQFINDMNRQLTSTIYDPEPIASRGTVLQLVMHGKAFWNTKMDHEDFWGKKHESNKINEDKQLFSEKLIIKKKKKITETVEDTSFENIVTIGKDHKANDASPPKTKEGTKDTDKGSNDVDPIVEQQ